MCRRQGIGGRVVAEGVEVMFHVKQRIGDRLMINGWRVNVSRETLTCG